MTEEEPIGSGNGSSVDNAQRRPAALSFRAFHDAHSRPWHEFAHLEPGRRDLTEDAVRGAFWEPAYLRSRVLESATVEAHAWALLKRRSRRRSRSPLSYSAPAPAPAPAPQTGIGRPLRSELHCANPGSASSLRSVSAAHGTAAVAHARSLIALNEQTDALEEQVSAHPRAHPDAEIHLSILGIGEITGWSPRRYSISSRSW
ncbi:hypothetical protein [Streptomyces sp. SID3343]|uniref:hypothetical protein n=1 Tax=Streptomyces sp. SID3343 TaxID=2690260 RepID=UPI001371BFA4|nr:hypothetical protein [Streptomyces sp. SID3343]MYV97075.1 hypothetical protein [Streptomyces sp. SID3343]